MKERAIITTLFLAAAAILVAIVFPDRRHEALVIWILALLGYGLLESNAHTRRLVRERSDFDRLLEDPVEESHVPEDLKRLERGLGWMSYEPSYFDFRVRPILRELIYHRAREHLGVDLAENPQAAGRLDAELVGLISDKKAWELYGSRNLDTPDIARMITRIEQL